METFIVLRSAFGPLHGASGVPNCQEYVANGQAGGDESLYSGCGLGDPGWIGASLKCILAHSADRRAAPNDAPV